MHEELKANLIERLHVLRFALKLLHVQIIELNYNKLKLS